MLFLCQTFLSLLVDSTIYCDVHYFLLTFDLCFLEVGGLLSAAGFTAKGRSSTGGGAEVNFRLGRLCLRDGEGCLVLG